MTATHKRAEVPMALDGWRLLRLLCVVIGVTVFGLSLTAAVPGQGGWASSNYTAKGLERLTAVEFWTPASDVHYTVRVYFENAAGLSEELLFEGSGTAKESGYYAVAVSPQVPLFSGQAVVTMVHFQTADGAQVAETGEAAVRAITHPEGSPEAVTITKFVVTAPPVIAGTPMTFTVSATGTAAGHALTYVIDYGDGTPLVPAVPLCTVSPVVDCVTVPHTYTKAGTFNAKLTVTDTVDSTTLTTPILQVKVFIPVTVSASSLCGLVPLNVCFTGSASNGTPPYQYSWNFGDGTPNSAEQNPCHAYLKTGAFKAVLTVTDAIGATGSANVTINVLSPLTVTLTPASQDGIPVTVVNFCAGVSGGLPPYTYAWDFGDSSTGSAVVCPQHAYATVGVYTAKVTVADSCQFTSSATSTITVHKAPWIRITSPAANSLQHAQVNLTSTVMVEPTTTVTRVEYYVTIYGSKLYLGSSSTAPYAFTWDSRGVNGTFCFSAIAYDSLGRSNPTENDVCIKIANPTVDGQVVAIGNPFRLRIYGNYFQAGCRVFINSMPVPATVAKSSTLVVAKAGDPLKAMVPKGVPVIVSVVNPDGGVSLSSTYVR